MSAGRWVEVPVSIRRAVMTVAAVLGYGTGVHLVQLVLAPSDPYPSVPHWLAVYFVSLTVLNPIAAVLLLLRRRTGLVLACAVLCTDAAANAYANYVSDARDGVTAGRVGQAVITLLAVALLAAAPSLWPWLRPAARQRPQDGGGTPRPVVR